MMPAQDKDVTGFLNGFQASLPTKLPFNENGGHGGGDQGKAEQAPDHQGHAYYLAPGRLGDNVAVPHRGNGDHGPPEALPETLQGGKPLGGFSQEKPEASQYDEENDEGGQREHPLPLEDADDIDQGFSKHSLLEGWPRPFGLKAPSYSPSFKATVATPAIDGSGRLPQFSSDQMSALALAMKPRGPPSQTAAPGQKPQHPSALRADQDSKYEAQEVSDSQTLTRLTVTPPSFRAVPRRSNR
jgi:hypothetical protein